MAAQSLGSGMEAGAFPAPTSRAGFGLNSHYDPHPLQTGSCTPTNISDLGADLGQAVPGALVRGVEEVWAQQRLEGRRDGHEKQLGVVVTHSSHRAGRQLAQRSLHG